MYIVHTIHIHIDLGTTCIASDSPLPLKRLSIKTPNISKETMPLELPRKDIYAVVAMGAKEIGKTISKNSRNH
jgi:hypothetical protein